MRMLKKPFSTTTLPTMLFREGDVKLGTPRPPPRGFLGIFSSLAVSPLAKIFMLRLG